MSVYRSAYKVNALKISHFRAERWPAHSVGRKADQLRDARCDPLQAHCPLGQARAYVGLVRNDTETPTAVSRIVAKHQAELKRVADRVCDPDKVLTPEKELGPSQPLSDDEIVNLIAQHRPSAETSLAHLLPELRDLAKFYDLQEDVVWEHETRTFLIIPFLRALGWTERKIKIEMPVPCSKGRVD